MGHKTKPDRTHGKCHYCPATGRMTWDHVVPKSRGGPLSWWNIVLACGSCNGKKKDSLPTCRCRFCVAAQARWEKHKVSPEHFALPGWEFDWAN